MQQKTTETKTTLWQQLGVIVNLSFQQNIIMVQQNNNTYKNDILQRDYGSIEKDTRTIG